MLGLIACIQILNASDFILHPICSVFLCKCKCISTPHLATLIIYMNEKSIYIRKRCILDAERNSITSIQ